MKDGEGRPPVGQFVVVGMAEYEDAGWDELPRVRDSVRIIAALLRDLEYEQALPELADGGSSGEVIESLGSWRPAASRVVVYWTGHGHWEGAHYLAAHDSPISGLNQSNAISVRELGRLMAQLRATELLLILDCCAGGVALTELTAGFNAFWDLKNPPAGRPRPRLACIAGSRGYEKGEEGVLAWAIDKVAREWNGQWTEHNYYIYSDVLREAAGTLLGDPDRFDHRQIGGPCGLPNPWYQPNVPDEDVETKRRRRMKPDSVDEHLVYAARGIEVGEPGWHFTGRTAVLCRIASWLRDAEQGMFVVTGSPGTGKSAVLGRIVTLSVPEMREMAGREGGLTKASSDTLPPLHSVDVAIFARNKTVDDCMRAIAAGLGISVPPGGWNAADTLIEQVGRRERTPVTIVVDGLDEARPGQVVAIASVLLRPLAAQPGVRVLVGTRPDRAGCAAPSPGTERQLLAALGTHERTVLDDEDVTDDLMAYTCRRLSEPADSPLCLRPDRVARIAAAIVERSAGVFLFARIAARMVLRTPDPQALDAAAVHALLEDGLGAVFDRDLARYGVNRGRVLDLLRPLAWAEGAGIPRRDVWPALATALSTTPGLAYSDAEVTWALENAGFYIIESGEHEQTVYRLYHQTLVEHLRGHSPEDAQRRITEALLGVLDARTYEGWACTHPYLHHHLAGHAADAGLLPELISDPGWCVHTDPARTFPLVLGISNASRLPHARLYIRAAARLRGQPPWARAFILHETASYDELTARPAFDGGPTFADLPVLPARIVAVTGRPSAFHWQLSGHVGPVNAVVTFTDAQGRALLASGGDDATLRLWDPLTGEQIMTLSGHAGPVNTMTTFTDAQGRALLASGGDDATLRLWDPPASSEPLDTSERQRGAVRALTALTGPDGRELLIATGDALEVWMWDPLTGSGRIKIKFRLSTMRWSIPPIYKHLSSLRVRAVATLPMPDGTVLLATPVNDGRVWLRNVFDGRPRPKAQTMLKPYASALGAAAASLYQAEQVTALASFIDSNGRVLLAGGGHRVIWVWEPAAGDEPVALLEGHRGRVQSLAAFTAPDARVLLASAGDDGSLRVWDPTSGPDTPQEQSSGRLRMWEPFASRGLGLRSKVRALGGLLTRAGAVVVKADPDRMPGGFRMFAQVGQPITVAARTARLTGPGGQELLAVGGDDGTVRIKETSNSLLPDAFVPGDTVTELKGHTETVWAVAAFALPDGRVVLASGGDDKMVLVWDPFIGQELLRIPLSSRVFALTADDHGFLYTSLKGSRAALQLNPELLTSA